MSGEDRSTWRCGNDPERQLSGDPVFRFWELLGIESREMTFQLGAFDRAVFRETLAS